METNGGNKDWLDRIASNLDRLTTARLGLADPAQRTDQRIEALVEAQRNTEQRLVDFATHTEERLNALIAVVDELVRRPPPPPPAS